jgi:hypothetical protein
MLPDMTLVTLDEESIGEVSVAIVRAALVLFEAANTPRLAFLFFVPRVIVFHVFVYWLVYFVIRVRSGDTVRVTAVARLVTGSTGRR